MLEGLLESQVSHLQNGHKHLTHSLEKENEISDMLAPSGAPKTTSILVTIISK